VRIHNEDAQAHGWPLPNGKESTLKSNCGFQIVGAIRVTLSKLRTEASVMAFEPYCYLAHSGRCI